MLEFTAGHVSLAMAIGLVVAAFAPLGAAVLWMAASPTAWRWVAARSPLRWLAVAWAIAGLLLGNFGSGVVKHEVVGRARPSDQDVVINASIALQLLLVFAAGWAKSRWSGRHDTASVTPRPPRRATMRLGVALFMLWASLGATCLVLRFGPYPVTPSPGRDWGILTLATVSLALLVAMSVRIHRSRDVRRDGPPRNASDETIRR